MNQDLVSIFDGLPNRLLVRHIGMVWCKTSAQNHLIEHFISLIKQMAKLMYSFNPLLSSLDCPGAEQRYKYLLLNFLELKAIVAHNRNEEKDHAVMLLEWMGRQDTLMDKALHDDLFSDKSIAHL